MNSRIIVRNKAVFCLDSSLIFYDFGKGNTLFSKRKINDFLRTVCDEKYDYSTLLSYYNQSIKGIYNGLFVEAYTLDDCLAIGKNESNIVVYYFQPVSAMVNILPWRYPHLISEFGVTNSSIREVLKDWESLSFIDYFFKNCMGNNQFISKKHSIVQKDNIFEVDKVLTITIDEHICVVNNLNHKRQYLADSWWYTPETIINDMLSISVVKFGMKYRAFWCA